MDRKIEKKKWTWQRIAIIVVALSGMGFLANAIYKDAGTSRLNVQTERLLIDTVKQSNFQEYIPVTGVVLPIKTVVIGAVEGGRVEEKMVEDGAIVKQGQPLLRLSNPDLQLAYINQEANLVSQINQIRQTSLLMEQQALARRETALNVEYQIDLLSKRVRRNKELYKDGAMAQVEFEETEDEYENVLRRRKLLAETIAKDSVFAELQQEQTANSLDMMKRNLAIARLSLDNLIVKAPIDGQLSGLATELGELITEGSQIAQIDDLSNFKIRVRIDEFYISRIFTGQEGSFEFAGDSYTLRIQKIYPQVVSGAFEADMLFIKEVPDGIKRGQTVSVKLELSAQEQALLLARGGFYQATGGNWVYVLDANGSIARKRDIRVGRMNPNYYEVLEGLRPGELVITSSYENFGEKEELVLK